MFKKILGYFKYRNIIRENKEILAKRFGFRYDWLYGRLYTVLSIPEDKQEVLRTYGYEFLDNEVKKFLTTIDDYFFTIGLVDNISISKIDRIDAVNVLIVLRYRYKIHQAFLYTIIAIGLIILTVTVVSSFIKLLMMLINFILTI